MKICYDHWKLILTSHTEGQTHKQHSENQAPKVLGQGRVQRYPDGRFLKVVLVKHEGGQKQQNGQR